MNNQNNTELAAAGRQFRDLMSSDTALIEIAKMISNLADKLDVTTLALREKCKERDALAVENAQMLRLLTDISENHGEFVNEADDYMYASVPLDYVSEINMYVSRDVNAENPFAATDSAVAEIKSQAWIEAKDLAKSTLAADSVDHIDFLFDGKVQQLLKGAGHA